MKKRIFIILMIFSLLLFAAGCGSESDDRIAQLEQENAALQAQVDSLTAQLEDLGQTVGLASWSMDAAAWSSSNGATVSLTATPIVYQEGQTAAFSVWLEGDEITTVPCEWNGASYTASADLNAADGYCYYCILTAPNGNQTEVEVNTPANPTDLRLIDLQASLTPYSNMMLEDWKLDGGKLVITSGFIQLQLPEIGDLTYTEAALVFHQNGDELERQMVALEESESDRGYELTVSGVGFQMPEMEADHMLDLWLEVTLSNGQALATCAGSWYYHNGELSLAVG